MQRFATFFALLACLILPVGCQSTPAGTTRSIPDHRPGDFRLGVVVMTQDETDSENRSVNLAGGDGRYIVDSSSILRASFGAGSTLDTFPGFTRRLTPNQMDAIWLMAKDLLDHNDHHTALHAGQPQSMVKTQSGTIIEIHMNARDEVFVFDRDDQQAAAIVDALSTLAWVDTTPTTRP